MAIVHSENTLVGERLVAQCLVCGEPAIGEADDEIRPWTWRCEKHADRNPCAIEGCSRSTAADGRLDAGHYWLCGFHWRLVCPPHSRERRAYLRFFRIAKKHGWDDALRTRFWRYWHGLVRRGRRQMEDTGSIDVDEIHRMFGWDD